MGSALGTTNALIILSVSGRFPETDIFSSTGPHPGLPMDTLLLEEPGRLRLVDRPSPDAPGRGEARVRVRRVGVCGTDLHAFQGDQPFFTYPRILGHELGVEVTDVGPGVDDLRPGDRCAVRPYLHCGSCSACRAGRTNCCARLEVIGVHRDGGMREEILVPAEHLHSSAAAPIEGLALTEMWTIGAHAVDRADVQPDEHVLVRGAGPIGGAIAQFARLAGGAVSIVEPDPARRKRARERFSAQATYGPAPGLAEAISGGDPDRLFPVVFDATGSTEAMGAAFEFVRPGGRLVFVGIVQESIPLPDSLFHEREMSVLSSRNATSSDFERVLDLLETGDLDAADWVTHRLPLGEVSESLPELLERDSGFFKAVIDLDA